MHQPFQHRRVEAPVQPPSQSQPPPQPVDVQAALQDLSTRMALLEEQQVWIGEALLELLTQAVRHPRPLPTRAHDDEAGSSGTQHDD